MSNRRGVDIASYQGQPGQWAGPAGRIAWAAVKITEYRDGSGYVNPDAAADWKYLGAHRKGRVAYLFAHPDSSAEETVRFFTGHLTALGLEDGDAIAVDLEVTDGRTPAQVSEWAAWVLAALRKQFSRPPLVYTYLDFARQGNCAGLGGYPLWITDPSSPAGHPDVPPPWKTWAAHQYNIAGSIDRDILGYASVAEMRGALGKPGARHAKRHPVKVAVHKTRQGGRKVKDKAKKEPVMTAGTTASVLAVLGAYLQHRGLHLTATQLNAALTAVVALAGASAAMTARPARMGAYTAALGTLATACATFGLHLPPMWTGYQIPVVVLITGLLLRGHVSPKWDLAPPKLSFLPPTVLVGPAAVSADTQGQAPLA